MSQKIRELLDLFVVDSAKHSELAVPLPELSLASNWEEMYLIDQSGNKFHFKSRPEDPNAPDVVHAQKQLCKICKVPHSFFKSNRGAARDAIINSWIHALDPEDPKALVNLKTRKGAEVSTLRAILPATSSTLSPITALTFLQKALGGEGGELVFSSGLAPDSPQIHMRFLVGAEVTLGEEVLQVGVSLTLSELESSEVVGDVFLWKGDWGTSFFLAFEGSPYFSVSPNKVQEADYGPLILSLVERARNIEQDLVDWEDSDYPGPDRALSYAVSSGVVPKSYYSSIHREIQEWEEPPQNMLEQCRAICNVAADLTIEKRIKLERSCGGLLGLILPRG